MKSVGVMVERVPLPARAMASGALAAAAIGGSLSGFYIHNQDVYRQRTAACAEALPRTSANGAGTTPTIPDPCLGLLHVTNIINNVASYTYADEGVSVGALPTAATFVQARQDAEATAGGERKTLIVDATFLAGASIAVGSYEAVLWYRRRQEGLAQQISNVIQQAESFIA